MFCYQCEQTANGQGCRTVGNCGKDSTTAALQDLLVGQALRTATYASQARSNGMATEEADAFVVNALFTTVTNVNFDPSALAQLVNRGSRAIGQAMGLVGAGTQETLAELGSAPLEVLLDASLQYSIAKRLQDLGDDVIGLQELALYGIKGLCAYLHHAQALGFHDDSIVADIHSYLAYLDTNPSDVGALVAKSLEVGQLNMRVMALLDQANTGTYGHPEPTAVRVSAVRGKAILVSGHDLKDLEELLKQTEGKGINVYTHGEMLPAHAYPGLKKYKHLVGNFGGAWQVQGREFREFPGAILMTTNCIQKPAAEYCERIFTSGLVGWPDVKHVSNTDFGPVIACALSEPGFAHDEELRTILVGFGHNALMANAGTVIDAVKSGALKHIFLIGGCDGALHGRNYYTELAEKVPDDCLILTLACGKFRFNKLEFGTLGGLPRLLDVGQCNDAYSAIIVASELAKAFDCSVNDLPLSLVLSWYEQKAVSILLTLLSLGIKNIRIGPTLPAFISPNVLNALVENFNVMPITTPANDLEAMLA